MKKCPYCSGELEDTVIVCHHCGKSLTMNKEVKNSWVKVKGQLVLWGIFLCFCVAGVCWDTIINHTWRDKLSLQPTSSEELSTYWGVFIASSVMFILLVSAVLSWYIFRKASANGRSFGGIASFSSNLPSNSCTRS